MEVNAENWENDKVTADRVCRDITDENKTNSTANNNSSNNNQTNNNRTNSSQTNTQTSNSQTNNSQTSNNTNNQNTQPAQNPNAVDTSNPNYSRHHGQISQCVDPADNVLKKMNSFSLCNECGFDAQDKDPSITSFSCVEVVSNSGSVLGYYLEKHYG